MDTRPPARVDEPPGRGAGQADEPPPFAGPWGTWRALYAAVIGELLLVIVFCHWLTTRGR